MVTYGNGEVLFEGSANGFEIKYKGSITITDSPDNLFILADRTNIKGVMLDDSSLPATLFNYEGEFRILSVKSVVDDVKQRERYSIQGLGYWEVDNQKWEDDTSLWGTDNGTYLIGSPQRYNKHSIVVNNNLKTQYKGQFYYQDGSAVNENEPIHIHADGAVMTGGVHTEDSVLLKDSADERQTRTRITTTTTRSTNISGGGY
tara:strand:+ start:159 stop:767 length:609 start_codon:yes stop_codon:yes gene_type:complete